MTHIKSMDEFVNDNMSFNQQMSLNEMSQVNLNEKGLDKKRNLDSSVYYVYVKGEGSFKKFPHYHIRHKTENWDIRMNLDGTFHSIKTKSSNRQTDKDFKDIEKISIEWAKMPNVFEPQKTNSEVARDLWFRNNS
ncbi:MAG: hypothetical protein IKO56_02330 [Alphaproteobacteria bacterium]|nr:hypothetical protein [Alphaproteobacteria bacterium]